MAHERSSRDEEPHAPAEPGSSWLDDMLSDASTPSAPIEHGISVGQVIDAGHPVLSGRSLVRVTDVRGRTADAWLPALRHLVLRASDRVLVSRPSNFPEAIIVGVIDGFARRPESARTSA